jgi:hypothetical protein
VLSGAVLHFFDAGTSNTRTVYSNYGLSTSLGTTVTCDSGGFPTSDGNTKVEVYTGTSAYKVTLKNSSATTQWTLDNIVGALDTSTFAAAAFAAPDTDCASDTTDTTLTTGMLGTVRNGNPTGGSFTYTLPSAITATNGRGYTIRHVGTANSIVITAAVGQTIDGTLTKTISGQYESVSLVSDGANWHIEQDANRTVFGGTVTPEGYLTLTSGTPIITGDVAAATAVYYTPFRGNLLPLYDGTRFRVYEFSELTLTLASQHVLNSHYDVFAWLESGVVTIGTGPAWSTITAGAGARGSGAGTTQLTRTNGLFLNTVAMTTRNSSTTYSVGALRGTYLGSLYIDGTAGQITCHRTYGQSRKWGVWNAYNRQDIALLAGDSTSSWAYTTATLRAANNATANSLTVFCGLAEELIHVECFSDANNGTANVGIQNGIGWNSTSAASGKQGAIASTGGASVPTGIISRFVQVPSLGINVVTALEYSIASGTTNWFGGVDNHLLTARWRG